MLRLRLDARMAPARNCEEGFEMKLKKGQVALITGTGNGFGREFALEAARRGMRLFIVDIDDEDNKRTRKDCKALGADVIALTVDVSLEEDVDQMVSACMRAYGRIDLLINNAGVAVPGTIDVLPTRDWQWIVETNCMSQVYAMQRVIPIMRKQSQPSYIVNVASLAGLTSMHNMPAYFATKHFSVALTESVFYDLKAHGDNIGMSVFCPGYIKTDLHHCERHRPERFQAPLDPYYSSREFAAGQELAEYEITNGTELAEVAPYVFSAIERDHFYIEIHPNAKAMVRHRNRDIVKERNPDYEYVRDMADASHGKADFRTMLRILRKR